MAQNPEEETAILLRGKVKEANGQEEEAEADYQLVTEVNPFNEQAYLYLGQLFINQKKLTEAISLFDEAIELNPNFAEAYKERGRAKLLNGDKDGSVEDMKRSLELNPKDEASLNGEFKNLGPNRKHCRESSDWRKSFNPFRQRVSHVFFILFCRENKKSIAFCLRLAEKYYFCPRIRNQSKKQRLV